VRGAPPERHKHSVTFRDSHKRLWGLFTYKGRHLSLSLSHSFLCVCVCVCVSLCVCLAGSVYTNGIVAVGSVRRVEKMGFNGLFARILPFIYIHYTCIVQSWSGGGRDDEVERLCWEWGDLARRVWHMCQKQGRKSRQTYSRTGLLPSPHPPHPKRSFCNRFI